MSQITLASLIRTTLRSELEEKLDCLENEELATSIRQKFLPVPTPQVYDLEDLKNFARSVEGIDKSLREQLHDLRRAFTVLAAGHTTDKVPRETAVKALKCLDKLRNRKTFDANCERERLLLSSALGICTSNSKEAFGWERLGSEIHAQCPDRANLPHRVMEIRMVQSLWNNLMKAVPSFAELKEQLAKIESFRQADWYQAETFEPALAEIALNHVRSLLNKRDQHEKLKEVLQAVLGLSLAAQSRQRAEQYLKKLDNYDDPVDPVDPERRADNEPKRRPPINGQL